MKSNSIPKHIAIIMDGNGRWAKKRLMPRKAGHNEGVKNIEKISDILFSMGVTYVTLFAFSTENWKRPKDEVDGLMKLFMKYLKSQTPRLIKEHIALKIYGDLTDFADTPLMAEIERCEAATADGTKTLGICFNYGGRNDIIAAVNKLIAKGEPVDEKTFSNALYTGGIADPDIIIRTAGDRRISNFLLYQMAYSEIYFIDTLWPDFAKKDIEAILDKYYSTERRYGEIKE